jgi:flagellar M-ring protein FliF
VLPSSMEPLSLPSAPGSAALTGEIDDDFSMPDMPMVGRRSNMEDAVTEDPATRLRRLIAERQTESIEILRGWLEHEEEPA